MRDVICGVSFEQIHLDLMVFVSLGHVPWQFGHGAEPKGISVLILGVLWKVTLQWKSGLSFESAMTASSSACCNFSRDAAFSLLFLSASAS